MIYPSLQWLDSLCYCILFSLTIRCAGYSQISLNDSTIEKAAILICPNTQPYCFMFTAATTNSSQNSISESTTPSMSG